MNAVFDSSQRLILLVASRKKLEEMTACAQVGPAINNVVNSDWTGILPKLALQVYKKVGVESFKHLSDGELLENFNRVMDLGFPVAWCSPIEAKNSFDFGVGHIPKDGMLYLQHPVNERFYISPGEFSRSVCSEKEAAFLRLAASLGAKSIKLISIQSNETKGFFGGGLKLPEVAADLGFRATFDKEGNLIKETVKEFNRPNFSKPSIPEQLAGWVSFDPDLRTMASDRIEANVAKSNVKLEFSQSIGLGGEISAKIADRGFLVGGGFKATTRSIWLFEVEYFDLNKS